MTVYYLSPDNNSTKVTAFKPVNSSNARGQVRNWRELQGFRMLVGTAEQRIKDSQLVNLFRCYDAKNFEPNPMGVAATDTSDLPMKYCAGGIRVNTFFPTWDNTYSTGEGETYKLLLAVGME